MLGPGKMVVVESMGEGHGSGALVAVPISGATLYSLSLYDSSRLRATFPLPEPRVSGHKSVFVHFPSRVAPVFLADSHLSLADKIPSNICISPFFVSNLPTSLNVATSVNYWL